MFKSLFGRGSPTFDPALGDRLGKIILKEARQGKLDTLLREGERLRDGAWDQRAFYITLASQYLLNPHRINRLPETPLSHLLKGRVGIHMAWKSRGYGTGDTVSEEGAKLFWKHLDAAEKSLLRAAEQDDKDPTPFAFLQTVARGLQCDRNIADAWFHKAIQRDPLNQQAHYQHLFLVCKKWGGSHEEMYDFARTTMEKVPTHSTLYPIVYLAFQERYLYFLAFDRDKEGARAFLRDKRIREESITVYQKSLQHRKTIEHVSDYWPHNLAAWWFFMLNMPAQVRQETEKIGPYCTEEPWSLFYKDPAVGYQKALEL